MKGEPTEPARDAGEGNAMNDKGRRLDWSEGLGPEPGEIRGIGGRGPERAPTKGPARGVTDDKEAPRAVIMNNYGRGGVKPSPLAKY